MILKLTQLVDNFRQEFEKSQCALDKYMAHNYVQKLIYFSKSQSLSPFALKNMVPFHYYQASLKVSFHVYSLKQHPELIQLNRPCLIMRLFKKWEKKSVTINIFTTTSSSRNECVLFINEKPVKNNRIDDDHKELN
ncbi:hypothetical protein K9325_004096 [Salmonella enterica subsp. enterica serovar Kinondoni]|nr:hypothetical protein [Salmonella enterica subsp. enterica serovar Kinondoni]MKU04193.1 hypothetical protein [Salmonella enterica subsp. enterica serovar Kinondoni]